MAISDLINKLREGRDLQREEMVSAMKLIMSGGIAEDQLVDFLTALRDKGETVDEVVGAATVMRKFSLKVKVDIPNMIDTCGTGGDNKGTFNISTAAAFVVTGAGVAVAKHGNRSVSSKSGSADVLEALGVKIDLPPEVVARCLKEAGIGFMFAPIFHPAMKNVAAARKKIGTRTIFNLLGPLTNPAGSKRQVMGVFDKKWLGPMAEILGELGSERAAVVHGNDGLDEVTTTGKTSVAEWDGKRVKRYEIDPADYKIKYASIDDLKGGDAKYNAGLIMGILGGETGPKRDIVVLNAALALCIAGKAEDMKEGICMAGESIAEGEARETLGKLQMTSTGWRMSCG